MGYAGSRSYAAGRKIVLFFLSTLVHHRMPGWVFSVMCRVMHGQGHGGFNQGWLAEVNPGHPRRSSVGGLETFNLITKVREATQARPRRFLFINTLTASQARNHAPMGTEERSPRAATTCHWLTSSINSDHDVDPQAHDRDDRPCNGIHGMSSKSSVCGPPANVDQSNHWPPRRVIPA